MDAPPIQYVKTRDGFNIAYCIAGAGVPLVYMPQPSSHVYLLWRLGTAFRSLYEHLAERFRLICYDSRGMGSSTRGLAPDFGIDDFETDLETVVDNLDLQDFILLAQSGFARVAISYAVRNSERLRALVLWNPDTGDAGTGFAPMDFESLAMNNWDAFVDMMARTSWIPEEPAVARQLIKESQTSADWLVRARAWPRFRINDIASEVHTPTLILASSKSSATFSFEEPCKFLAAEIAGSRLEIIEDAGGGLFSRASGVPAGVTLLEQFVAHLPPDIVSATSDLTDSPLSDREIEVLRLLASGKSNAQIAGELVISLNTVRRHVSNIFDKTGVANRAQAGAYARDHGLA